MGYTRGGRWMTGLVHKYVEELARKISPAPAGAPAGRWFSPARPADVRDHAARAIPYHRDDAVTYRRDMATHTAANAR
jgi:hypothetical protein